MPTMVEIWKAEALEEGLALGEAKGIALGETKGKAEAVIGILEYRFAEIPKALAISILTINDIERLNELFKSAFECDSLESFAELLA